MYHWIPSCRKIASNDIHRHLLNVYGDQTMNVSLVKWLIKRFSSGDSNGCDKTHSKCGSSMCVFLAGNKAYLMMVCMWKKCLYRWQIALCNGVIMQSVAVSVVIIFGTYLCACARVFPILLVLPAFWWRPQSENLENSLWFVCIRWQICKNSLILTILPNSFRFFLLKQKNKV